MKVARKHCVAAAIWVIAGVEPSFAQVDGNKSVALGLSASVPHFLGLTMHGCPLQMLCGAARLEGLLFGLKRVRGIGLRVDPVMEPTTRIYVEALGGDIRCIDPRDNSCPFGAETRIAFAGIAGLEMAIGIAGWSAGVEGGYWKPMQNDTVGRSLKHWTVGTFFRKRITFD